MLSVGISNSVIQKFNSKKLTWTAKHQKSTKVYQGPTNKEQDVLFVSPSQESELGAIKTGEIETSTTDQQQPPSFSLPLTGPPRVSSPILPNRSPTASRSLPLMLYIPGIDGTGFAATQQFETLIDDFDLKCLTVPPGDRTSFVDLIAYIKDYLVNEASDSPVKRPIYLLGESFGGLLAMAAALECNDLVDRLILVNPATSYLRTIWPIIAPTFSLVPTDLYNLLPILFAPSFINPAEFVNVSSFEDQLEKITDLVQNKLPGIMQLTKILPADTLIWKLTCLKEGCDYMEAAGYQNVQQRTLVITGDLDLLVPSDTEGPRLEKILPRAKNIRFEDRAHVILQDEEIELAGLIRKNGFYIKERRMTSFPQFNVRKGNQYGKAGPIEVPTMRELEQDKKATNIDLAQKILSPMFFSTNENGVTIQGLENLPQGEQLLFIGNRQQLPLDYFFIMEAVLKEKGVLPRSLVHPQAFQQNNYIVQAPEFQKIMCKYGAITASTTNLCQLIQIGESAMLLIAGNYHTINTQKNKYKIQWPKTEEVIHTAAKFGATIVPLSSFGLEDSIVDIFWPEQIQKLPVLGGLINQSSGDVFGGIESRAMGQSQLSVPQIVLPTVPQRFYVKFGKPIKTDSSWLGDSKKCSEVLLDVERSVQEGISYLAEKRNQDPYKDFVFRSVFEASWGFKKQAPTFQP